MIYTKCPLVLIYSVSFKTQSGEDILRIEGDEFSGNQPISTYAPSTFTIHFTSSAYRNAYGFELRWKCAEMPDHSNCCSILTLKGAENPLLNQIYFHEGSSAYGSYYRSFDNRFGIWFSVKWIVGPVSNIEKGKISSGYLSSEKGSNCPTSSQRWKEQIDFSWSSYRNGVMLQCEGKYIVCVSYT